MGRWKSFFDAGKGETPVGVSSFCEKRPSGMALSKSPTKKRRIPARKISGWRDVPSDENVVWRRCLSAAGALWREAEILNHPRKTSCALPGMAGQVATVHGCTVCDGSVRIRPPIRDDCIESQHPVTQPRCRKASQTDGRRTPIRRLMGMEKGRQGRDGEIK